MLQSFSKVVNLQACSVIGKGALGGLQPSSPIRHNLPHFRPSSITIKSSRSPKIRFSASLNVGHPLRPCVQQSAKLSAMQTLSKTSQASDILHFHLFADDTSLFYSHKDINILEEIPWVPEPTKEKIIKRKYME